MNFGRLPSPDPRDHQYLMRRKLMIAPKLPSSNTWAISTKSLDQGATSTCVGHAWRNFLRCAPMKTEKGGPSQFDIYRSAVANDAWTDNDNEAKLPDGDPGFTSGTSVRAGAEAVLKAGRLKSYLWAFDLQTVVEWVLTQGPVVLGTNWYSSMMTVDADGLTSITPNAGVVGGHAFLLRGVNTKRSLATLENSWGDSWGKKGTFYLPLHDLERLVHEDGEACTAIEQKMQAVTPT